jgi:hypothetical protein
MTGGRLSGVCPQPFGYSPNVAGGCGGSACSPSASAALRMDPGSFTVMLSALMTARTAASAAGSLWELAGRSRLVDF